jgi:hypothetical protein
MYTTHFGLPWASLRLPCPTSVPHTVCQREHARCCSQTSLYSSSAVCSGALLLPPLLLTPFLLLLLLLFR